MDKKVKLVAKLQKVQDFASSRVGEKEFLLLFSFKSDGLLEPSVSKLLYGCTTKHIGKMLDRNYTRMLPAILNKSWKQQHTKQQLYSHLPPILKTIQVRQTRHAVHCWRSKYKHLCDVLPSTLTHRSVGRPARTHLPQLCADTECNFKDLLGGMDNRDGWRERVRKICAGSATSW